MWATDVWQTYGTFKINKYKGSTAFEPFALDEKNGSMFSAEFSVHNTQISFVSSSKNKGAPLDGYVDGFPFHGSFGAMQY